MQFKLSIPARDLSADDGRVARQPFADSHDGTHRSAAGVRLGLSIGVPGGSQWERVGLLCGDQKPADAQIRDKFIYRQLGGEQRFALSFGGAVYPVVHIHEILGVRCVGLQNFSVFVASERVREQLDVDRNRGRPLPGHHLSFPSANEDHRLPLHYRDHLVGDLAHVVPVLPVPGD